MFGIRYIKFQPGDYVLKYKNGKIVREGAGISFYYYAPKTSIVVVPAGSTDVPFIFEELTSDFQSVTVQGQIAFRISHPKKITQLLDYSVNLKNGRIYVGGGQSYSGSSGYNYSSGDPKKLEQRVINIVQVITKKTMESLPLQQAIRSSDVLAKEILNGLKENEVINLFGIDILDMSILAILPNKETARALEAQAREQILKKADEAIYERRNASIEQERIVKENEFNTEIAVENKKRQVKEAQLDAEKAMQQKTNELAAEQLQFETNLEEQKKALIEQSVENSNAQADAKAYELAAVMQSIDGIDPAVIESLAGIGMDPASLIALAFRGLAQNADKIGQLNISPDLMSELLQNTR